MNAERLPLREAGNEHGCSVELICLNYSDAEPIWDECQTLITRDGQTLTQAARSYAHFHSNVYFLAGMHMKYCQADGPKDNHHVLVRINLPTDDEGPCYFNLNSLIQRTKSKG